MKNLGHRAARSTIAKILKEQGIPPSDERPTSWQTFLRAHWGARHLTAATDGVLQERCFLICDRDRKWSTGVRHLLETSGVRVVQTPYRAPNGNAHAERFVRSIKDECLNRVIPLGERHFRRTLAEFVAHYHRVRNHQGGGNDLIDGAGNRHHVGSIRRRERLGGLLSYYHRAA